VNFGTERDVLDRQRISRKDIRVLAAVDHRVHFQPNRSDDVSLLAVEIGDQSDVSRAVRIVFDLRNLAGDARLVTLEIDDPVMPFVASAAAANGDPSVAIVTGNFLLRFEQRLLGGCSRRQLVARQISLIASCR
jgi:hypothetical protein